MRVTARFAAVSSIGLLLVSPGAPAFADPCSADLRVSAGQAGGEVGQLVRLRLGLTNQGPDVAQATEVEVHLVAPVGTELVDIGGTGIADLPGCGWVEPGTQVRCHDDGPYLTEEFSLAVRIVSAGGAPGRFAAECGCDPDSSNNVTALVVDVAVPVPATTAALPSAPVSPTPQASPTRVPVGPLVPTVPAPTASVGASATPGPSLAALSGSSSGTPGVPTAAAPAGRGQIPVAVREPDQPLLLADASWLPAEIFGLKPVLTLFAVGLGALVLFGAGLVYAAVRGRRGSGDGDQVGV